MADLKKAFITGITGQDGSYLAEFLLDKGYQVVGLVRRSTHYHYENIEHLVGKVVLEYGDLIDANTIERVVAEYQPAEVSEEPPKAMLTVSVAVPLLRFTTQK